MHTLEPELRELQAHGVIDEATATRAVALDRGVVFSLHEELRVALYAAVALITTGLGILVKENLNRIGPVTVIVILALIAAGCYASAIRKTLRGETRSIGADYVLLLGALIVSVDVGYAESQFHWLGAHWSLHLLLLAILHAVTAYLLDSRLVLSIALTSFAGWLGIEPTFGDVFDWYPATPALGLRALVCAAVILGWRIVHQRLSTRAEFQSVLEHFAANIAFWGSLAWSTHAGMRMMGVPLLLALASVSIWKGLRSQQEAFAVYGVVYAAIGTCIALVEVADQPLLIACVLLAMIVGAALLLRHLQSQIRESRR